ncbi:class I SAM-dependent methyltransferase [Candidatus Parabeggiatoa sp. HSG14]|uniref:class I SAM-dependent methyltransferase n=1 Tax=Candidatus Parabeggiatoa sp. HSG14 TaxID=3055593 RepID=UPI0025A79394|nr:class I SAM-dependent methyltransferase [Thiotrichales bacterium HSG14]
MTTKCRFCGTNLQHVFCNLGMSPVSNAYLKQEQLQHEEPFYPLCAYVCQSCYLVQLQAFQNSQSIFTDYAYFSSYSDTWLEHAKAYTEYMIERFKFNSSHHIVEIASNDGYLLQHFKTRDIPVLGIEPAENVAKVAKSNGIPSLIKFFGQKTAIELIRKNQQADLLIGNNVLAHVPDLNDFVKGLKILLKPEGIITMEFPHLLQLMKKNQFDTIHHEHFSYFSLLTVEKVFAQHGLILFDVEEISTHGGSLRIFAKHQENSNQPILESVNILKQYELQRGLADLPTYLGFSEKVKKTKRQLLDFLITAKRTEQSIVGYGAPAKGNTLLNYCGIRRDFIDYTVDRSPHKQGLFLPGTHIPIYSPNNIKKTKPNYLLILPWNIKDEIIKQMAFIRTWGGKFVIPIPQIEVLP